MKECPVRHPERRIRHRCIAVQEAGGAEFRELRKRDQDHQIEKVGAECVSRWRSWIPSSGRAARRRRWSGAPPLSKVGDGGAATPTQSARIPGPHSDGPRCLQARSTAGPLVGPTTACASSTRRYATVSRRRARASPRRKKLEVARQLARLRVDVIEAGSRRVGR